MKVVIAGSRSIKDYSLVERVIENSDLRDSISEVVCGMAQGVDYLGQLWANRNKIPVAEFPANWVIDGRGAGIIRNFRMAKYCDAAIILWDGESKGSVNMKKQMEKLEKPFIFFNLNDQETRKKTRTVGKNGFMCTQSGVRKTIGVSVEKERTNLLWDESEEDSPDTEKV